MDFLCHGKQRQTQGDLKEICEFLVLWEAETYPRRPQGDLWIPCVTGSRDMLKETSRRSVDSLCHGSRDIHKETSRRSVDSLCHGK